MMIYRGRNLKNPYNKHKERVHFIVKRPMWVMVHVAASYIILFLDHGVYPP